MDIIILCVYINFFCVWTRKGTDIFKTSYSFELIFGFGAHVCEPALDSSFFSNEHFWARLWQIISLSIKLMPLHEQHTRINTYSITLITFSCIIVPIKCIISEPFSIYLLYPQIKWILDQLQRDIMTTITIMCQKPTSYLPIFI